MIKEGEGVGLNASGKSPATARTGSERHESTYAHFPERRLYAQIVDITSKYLRTYKFRLSPNREQER